MYILEGTADDVDNRIGDNDVIMDGEFLSTDGGLLGGNDGNIVGSNDG